MISSNGAPCQTWNDKIGKHLTKLMVLAYGHGRFTSCLLSPMTDDDPTLDYVDYTSISFPSDNLTVGKIRKLYPHRFDVEDDALRTFFEANAGKNTHDSKEPLLWCMLTAERYLARHAFEDALGHTWTCVTELGDTRDESAKELGEMYTHFGLASGPQHADQLIRAFEAQAAAQAKPPHGPALGSGR